MKFSIKYKFSIFIILILFFVVGILCFLFLDSIQNFQLNKQENFLKSQKEKIEMFFSESYRTSNMILPEKSFFKSNALELCSSMSILCGMKIEFYDISYKKIATTIDEKEQLDLSPLFEFVNNKQESYIKSDSYIYYITQISGKSGILGYVSFQYPINKDINFFNTIKDYLITISIIIFIISIIISIIFFSRYSTIIYKLKESIDKISNKNYEIKPLTRNDEFGDLSCGIINMGKEIERNIKNITKEKNNLNLAVEKLQIMGKQQKQFISNFTHEFKSPLTSIRIYIDLLKIYKDDASLIDEAITNIDAESSRLLNMANKILELRKIEKYSFEYTCEIFEIKPFLEKIIQSMVGKASKYDISIDYEIVNSNIFVEKESFRHIISNLIDNAIKYNKPGGNINIKTFTENNFIKIYIKDSGIGIDKGNWDKVFEPFYRVEKSLNISGTGLGLSIVNEMVLKQGGKIQIIDSDKNGTTFLLEFQRYFKN